MKYFYEATIQIFAEDDDDEYTYSLIQSFDEEGADPELIVYGAVDSPKEALEEIYKEIGDKHG